MHSSLIAHNEGCFGATVTTASPVKKLKLHWPVVEIFGPTVQGEGIDQGVVCHFVRFGGCDYRCAWCDTPYAVLPDQVRANSTSMTSLEIREDLEALGHVPWVILTGGNPALLNLEQLVEELHSAGFLVAVETQGSRWRDWLKDVDRLCVSPKPPSSLEPKSQFSALHRFLDEAERARHNGEKSPEWMFLKVVCFTTKDVEYAELIRKQMSSALLYLSAGNDAGRTVGNPTREDRRTLEEVRRDLLNQTAWLTAEVFQRPDLCTHDVFIQHQLHTALWGNGRGF